MRWVVAIDIGPDVSFYTMPAKKKAAKRPAKKAVAKRKPAAKKKR